MPKIPVYQQQVELAAGNLGPRASSAAFEAPGRAAASFGKQAGDIAFRFAMAEKEAETTRVSNEVISSDGQRADDLVRQPKSKTVQGFDVESGAFKRDSLAAIDARNDLTSRQKDAVKLNLSKTLDRKFSIGRAAVFTKQQTERASIMDEGIENLMRDAANKQMRPNVISDIQALIDSGQQQGLKIKYDMDDVSYEIDKNDILADITNDAIGVDQLKEKRDEILQGKGDFGKYTADKRQTLAGKLTGRISYLTNGAVAEAKAQADDITTTIALNGDDTGAKAVADRFRQLGRFAEAEQFESSVIVSKKVYTTFDAIKLAPMADGNQAIRDALDLAKTGPTSERAENYRVYKELLTRETARQQAISQDAVGYLEQAENRTLTVSERIEKQKMLGIAEQDIVPFSMAEFNQFKSELETADPVVAMRDLKQFFSKERFGESAVPAAMRNGMNYAQNLALFNQNNPRSIDLLGSAQIPDKQLKADLKEADIKEIDIDIAIRDELEDWTKSVIGGTADGMLSRMGGPGRYMAVVETEKALSKLAKVYVTRGMSVDDAAKAAANMVTGNYVFQQFNNTQMRIPAILAKQAGQINKYLDDRLNADEYLEGTVAPIEGGRAATEDATAQYISEIRTMGGWITMPNDTGVYLVDKLGNQVVKNVTIDGELVAQPIVIEFADVLGAAQAEGEYGTTETLTGQARGANIMEELRLR